MCHRLCCNQKNGWALFTIQCCSRYLFSWEYGQKTWGTGSSLYILKACTEKWHSYFLSTSYPVEQADIQTHIFRASWACLHICRDWQPDAVPWARPQPSRQAPRAVTGVSRPALPCSPSELRAVRPPLPAWQMPRQRRCEWCGEGWQNRAKSLCNQRVWLGGDGGSAGTQTFTIGQAVLVNRSGCTKEAGWIIDRM